MRRQKQGSATTKEARLEAVDGEVLAGSVSEIDGAVEGLLGLTFEHFTRAVVLPQNEFARFLHDKPAARQDLLIKLLGFDVYERMMRNARARAAEQETVVKLAQQRLEKLDDCTPEQLEVWEQWVKLYQELRDAVRAARRRRWVAQDAAALEARGRTPSWPRRAHVELETGPGARCQRQSKRSERAEAAIIPAAEALAGGARA